MKNHNHPIATTNYIIKLSRNKGAFIMAPLSKFFRFSYRLKLMLMSLVTTFLFSPICKTDTEFQLTIKGMNFDVKRNLLLGNPSSKNSTLNFNFFDKRKEQYNLALKYKELPSSRSFPSNIDLTVSKGEAKLGYLFFAVNNLEFLRKIGNFGININIDNDLVNFNFQSDFARDRKGNIDFNLDLDRERFFQDTLLPKKNFQMIRPVILPLVKKGVRSKEFNLDNHPYSIEYKLLDTGDGTVVFQHNFYEYSKDRSSKNLLFRVYFQSHSMEELREAMYAGKAFNFRDAPAKLVFYPSQGQTEPKK